VVQHKKHEVHLLEEMQEEIKRIDNNLQQALKELENRRSQLDLQKDIGIFTSLSKDNCNIHRSYYQITR
jgi:hypothetical protein